MLGPWQLSTIKLSIYFSLSPDDSGDRVHGTVCRPVGIHGVRQGIVSIASAKPMFILLPHFIEFTGRLILVCSACVAAIDNYLKSR